MVGGESMETLNRRVLSLLRKLVSDSEILTSAGSCSTTVDLHCPSVGKFCHLGVQWPIYLFNVNAFSFSKQSYIFCMRYILKNIKPVNISVFFSLMFISGCSLRRLSLFLGLITFLHCLKYDKPNQLCNTLVYYIVTNTTLYFRDLVNGKWFSFI